MVELRKLQKSYLQFIKTSQRFYRQYILNLDAQFDGIPELRQIARKWKDDPSRAPVRRRGRNLALSGTAPHDAAPSLSGG